MYQSMQSRKCLKLLSDIHHKKKTIYQIFILKKRRMTQNKLCFFSFFHIFKSTSFVHICSVKNQKINITKSNELFKSITGQEKHVVVSAWHR
jgi:hypothetical protein